MKRGERAILKSGKRRIEVTVIHDHSLDQPSFPAVTVYKGDSKREEYIVGRHELLSMQEQEIERLEQLEETKKSLSDIITAFEAGNISIMAIAKHLNKQHCEVLSRCLKAERLGFVKLVKEAK